MKKMVFGGLSFMGGLIGIITFISQFTERSDNYNTFVGFLEGENFIALYIMFIFIALIGFLICLFEAYKDYFIKLINKLQKYHKR